MLESLKLHDFMSVKDVTRYVRRRPMANAQLTKLELRRLLELSERGPTHHLPKEACGRLALYKMTDEAPDGWTLTALGRGALGIEPHPGALKEVEKSPRHSPTGKRRYGKKRRMASWLG